MVNAHIQPSPGAILIMSSLAGKGNSRPWLSGTDCSMLRG